MENQHSDGTWSHTLSIPRVRLRGIILLILPKRIEKQKEKQRKEMAVSIQGVCLVAVCGAFTRGLGKNDWIMMVQQSPIRSYPLWYLQTTSKLDPQQLQNDHIVALLSICFSSSISQVTLVSIKKIETH